MAKIYHIVIGCTEQVALFREIDAEKRMKDYIKLYKDRTGIENYGYCFTDHRLHLAVRDKTKRIRDFLHGVCDAFAYYYQLKRETHVTIRFKLVEIEPRSELLDLLRFIHNRGRNSALEYRDYSRYRPNRLVDSGPILATLHSDLNLGKEMFFDEMVHEPKAGYYIEFANREIFELDKMTKRRQRAQEFMEDFLKEMGLSRGELLNGNQEEARIDLIHRFRKETDLSFRDIGHVFGLSHTSIIRLYQQRNQALRGGI